MSYATDRAWSDQFIPHMRRIIGPHLLEPSSVEVDMQQAADLVVFRARDVTIACRVRRYGYKDRYPFEFTIRSARDSGARTEYEKLTDGWGDWMFYGHAAERGPVIERWWLLDLHAWRAALIRDRDCIVVHSKSNGDGTHFVSYDVRSFPVRPGCKPLVIAASHPLEREEEPAKSRTSSPSLRRPMEPEVGRTRMPTQQLGLTGW